MPFLLEKFDWNNEPTKTELEFKVWNIVILSLFVFADVIKLVVVIWKPVILFEFAVTLDIQLVVVPL